MTDHYHPHLSRRMQLLLLSAMISTTVLLTACGGDPPAPAPDPLEEQMKLLAASWKLGTVTNDGVDVTSKYTGFTLTITADKTFTTTKGHNAWPASGTFTFVGKDPKNILRNDDIPLTIGTNTTTSLELTFNVATVGGRNTGVTGQFIFSLVK